MNRVRVVLLFGALLMLVGQANLAQTSAQQSTPVSPDKSIDGGETFQQRFLALADSMPDWLDRSDVSIHYADLAWRAEFVGVDYSNSEDGLIEARAGIGMAIPPAFMYAADFPALGFTSSQVSRTLVLDAVSDKITLMEGTFDFAIMRTGLLESGYTEEEIDGVAVFVFGGDDHIDIAGGAAGRVAISGKTQYAVLLDDGLVGFTNKRVFAEQLIATHLGDLPALSAQSDIQDLLASTRADLVSAQIWSLDALVNDVSAGGPAELADIAPGLGVMPAFDWILFGDSVGTGWSDGINRAESEPDAAAVIVLKMSDAEQAAAALDIVPARFDALTSIRTSAPYRELLTFKSAQAGATESLVAFEFGTPIIGRIGQMWLAQDLRFVYPG